MVLAQDGILPHIRVKNWQVSFLNSFRVTANLFAPSVWIISPQYCWPNVALSWFKTFQRDFLKSILQCCRKI